jgi:hypothetical protein
VCKSIDFLNSEKSSEIDDLYLEEGLHTYDFQLELPSNLPTSFEHEDGIIRYSIYSTIHLSNRYDDICLMKNISLISELNLNDNPALRSPIEENRLITGYFMKNDPITVDIILLKGGYVCGENINFNVTIDNKSSKEIKSCRVQLVQNIIFHTAKKVKKCKRTVISLRYRNRIGPKTQETWSSSAIHIPAVCPSSNGLCKIIDISYCLIFKFEPTGIFNNKSKRNSSAFQL